MRDQPAFQMTRETGIAVAVHAQRSWIRTGQKSAAAGGADGRLAKGVGEGGGLLHKGVKARGVDMGVVERADGIKALLVGAVPEDVWAVGHGCSSKTAC